MTAYDFNNKVVVITGASGGIGNAAARLAAEEGATVVLLARSEDKLAETEAEIVARGGKASHYLLDVADKEAVTGVFRHIFDDHRRIDVLINNAGFGVFAYFDEADMNDVEAMFDVNVLGLMACAREVVPKMLEAGGGHIINVASIAGKMATPKSTVYSASKHAVLGFSNGLRMELAGTGVCVTSVNPGPVRTNFFNVADPGGQYMQNVERFLVEPDDVAQKIIQAVGTSKREVNVPKSMSFGASIYQLLPSFVEKAAGKLFRFK